MYTKEKPIILKGSTSHLCNNLSLLVTPEKGSLCYCVVHKAIVSIVTASTDGATVTGKQVVCKEPSAAQGNPTVLEAKWVNLSVRPILVLTSSRGIQMFDADGSVMIYWHALNSVGDGTGNYGKGIAGVGESVVCVGTENGEILAFNVPVKGPNVTLLDTLKSHQSPIASLAAEGNTLASADDMGNIHIWMLDKEKLLPVVKIKGAGSPCSSLAVWQGVVVGGYGSGHLRVFNASTGKIGAEVAAHGRWINAVDVATDSGLLVSASDDAFFRIWKLGKGALPTIEFVSAENVTDVQLVGAKFVDGQGRALCVTGYDTNDIKFFVRQ